MKTHLQLFNKLFCLFIFQTSMARIHVISKENNQWSLLESAESLMLHLIKNICIMIALQSKFSQLGDYYL